MTSPPATCPACGAAATGRFCSSCGATAGAAICPECSTPLAPGARFCHRCGASAVGAPQVRASTSDSALPWAVAAIALVALTALVAGQQFRGGRDAEASRQPVGGPPVTADGIVRGPDISQMTPSERAEALFNRIMRLDEAGHVDSVRFFAPMAIATYQMLDPIGIDQRYELGRIGIATGLTELTRAQADTILASNPRHLLGLALAAAAARADGDAALERSVEERLIGAQQSELARGLPEYQRYRSDIIDALRQAQLP